MAANSFEKQINSFIKEKHNAGLLAEDTLNDNTFDELIDKLRIRLVKYVEEKKAFNSKTNRANIDKQNLAQLEHEVFLDFTKMDLLFTAQYPYLSAWSKKLMAMYKANSGGLPFIEVEYNPGNNYNANVINSPRVRGNVINSGPNYNHKYYRELGQLGGKSRRSSGKKNGRKTRRGARR